MKKKTLILKAATYLFATKGYNTASMAELAKSTGVAQGTVFYHFNNKETLFLAVLKQFQRELGQAFKDYEQTSRFENGLEALLEKVEFFFIIAGKMEDEFLLLHRHDAYEIAHASVECRELLEQIHADIVGFFEQAIRIGQNDGSIAPHSARNMAMTIFTMVDGLVRFNTYGIYEAGALYEDFISAIRRIVSNETPQSMKGGK